MLKRHKIGLLLFCALPFFIQLTGCPEKENKGSEEPQVISWWHINSDLPAQKAFNEIAENFTMSHSGTIVEVTALDNVEFKSKLELQLASGDPPDVFHSWGGGDLAEKVEAGYLRDITDWVESDRWQSKINPAALEIYSYEGRVYGFPHDMGAVGFWYNEELLALAGYDSFPEDWDSYLVLLDDLQARGIQPIALGIADRWPVMYYWVYLTMRIGGSDIYMDILNGKREFSDPAALEAAQLMKELYSAGYFPESALGDDYVSEARLMGDGICAMELMGQWALSIQAQASNKGDELASNMKFAPFPTVKGGSGSLYDAMGGGNGFVIGKNAPDEAIELLEYFTREEVLQKYFDAFPAVPTVEGVEIESQGLKMVQQYVQNAEHYSLYPDQLFPNEIGAMLNEISVRILLDDLSPEEGCRLLDEAWDSYQSNSDA